MKTLIIFVVICTVLFLSVQASAQLASKDILKEADELRLSDRTVAKQLLDSIEVDTLTGDDKVYFKYLSAVIGTFDGDIKQTAECPAASPSLL